jgi:hypothetical protein
VDREILTQPESDLLSAVRLWQERHDRTNGEVVATLLVVARYVLLRFTEKK